MKSLYCMCRVRLYSDLDNNRFYEVSSKRADPPDPQSTERRRQRSETTPYVADILALLAVLDSGDRPLLSGGYRPPPY